MAAPEAPEGPLRLVGLEPWAFVGHGQPRQPVAAFDGNRDPAVRRPVPAAVLEEIVDRASEGSSVPAYSDRFGGDDLDPRLAFGGCSGELAEEHVFLGHGGIRLLA